MNTKNSLLKTGLLVALGIIVLGVIYVFGFAAKQNHDANVPPIGLAANTTKFDLKAVMAGVPVDRLLESFPYNSYVKSSNINEIALLQEDLKTLQEMYPNKEMNIQETISVALTDSLHELIKADYQEFKPDSLIRLFQWTEQFYFYAQYDQARQPLYESVFNYWLAKINNNLARYTNEDPNVKYEFKYKYLVAKCAEKKSFVPVKVGSSDKVMYNLMGGHWSHLWNASWNQASAYQKIFFMVILLMTSFAYLLLLRFFYQKIFTKKTS